uniref:C2H2-type domain-containing protein n=1 Tax=Nothobranchius korthausae TaxID=1143690 RepID=A0A1A8FE05_9TELE
MESAVNWSREDAQALCAAWSQIKHTSVFSWSKKEVHALLVYWANPSVQQDLLLKARRNAVYDSLSAKLASLGFNKSAQECKEKIRKLKQNYRKIKKRQNMGWSRTMQLGILGEALSLQPAASKCSEASTSSLAESSQLVATDMETNLSTHEAEWLPDEVQVLVTLWAQPSIQEQLLASGENSEVFTNLSNELALVGFNKTPQQCRVKVNKLIEEHKKILQVEPDGNDQSDWFVIMDGVLGSDGETSKDVNAPEDFSQAVWTSDEVDVLLTRWAEERVQERLAVTQEDESVYAQLSSELATQGFDKTANQCQTKVRLLKQEYERIREQNDSKELSWFALMDDVYGRAKPKTGGKPAAMVTESECGSVRRSEPDSEPSEGCRLSIPSLCLLIPTLRLMSAFAWQVVQCCNVGHYRKVEELVVLVTELAPELLTARERVQLLLRLRARLVLELCRSESTATPLHIQPHLDIILNLKMSSGCDQEDFEELENSKTNFVEVVQTLFQDPEERERFFTEVFPIHYGQQYEATLQSLVWKFISRLDSLLPIPGIKQTAEWLSSAPSVLEECGQLVLEREQLKELLDFHQKQTKYKCFSQTQNMFLPFLSLHPKPSSNQEESPISDEEGFDLDKESSEENQTEPVVDDSGRRRDDGENQQSEGSGPSRLHYCSKCSYTVGKVSDLLQHIRQTHLIQKPGNIFRNDITLMRGTTNPGLKISEFPKEEASSNSKGPPYQCDKCDKKYLNKSKLTIHYRNHTGETPFLCSTCGKGFRTSTALNSHSRTHTGDWRYKCDICGKTSIQQMARHMRMHRGEKNYLCSECGKAFLSSGELRLHMRSHTGERPYKCKQCGKGFIAKCILTRHIRQHTGEKPYRCSLCPKTFYSLRDKKRHLMIHTHKKSFQCLTCGRIFRQEDTFKLHVETHQLT